MKQSLTITLAQLNFQVCDIEGNAERILQACHTAIDDQHSDLIIFPEMALTGYTPEDLLLRDELHQRCQTALTHIQKNMPDITMVLGMPWKEGTSCYNAAIVLQQHTIIAKYYKQQLPNNHVFDEKRYFQAGQHSAIFNLHGFHFGLLICEDCWHDTPPQQAIAAGANALIIINASPFDQEKHQQRQQILSCLAITHATPIIYTNLIGGQDEMVFDGGSTIIDASGNSSYEAPRFKESLYACQFPPSEQHACQQHTHHPLTSIYDALVLGVKDYVTKNHFKGALIGLSGGIDSALTLVIAVDALGAESVTTVMMPSTYTSDMSLTDATQLASSLKVKHKTIAIDAIKNSVLNELQDYLQPQHPNTTEENIQARIRGLLLMALSNNSGHMVLTTGNRSEMAVGYATLYGDMAGGFAVLKDIPKTMVYDLAKHYNEQHPTAPIPHNIIERAPSAELAPNQQDQDTLPPYDVLDPILHYIINCQYSADHIEQLGFGRTIIDQIITLVKRNEYKRRQAPIGVRISNFAFGKDRRYPITSN